MIQVRTLFSGEEDKKEYVLKCEETFEKRLDDAMVQLVADKNNRIITLSGPTCAGKTTTAKKIVSEFSERGYNVHTISIDDFYYDRDVLIARSKDEKSIDFDSVNTIDLELLENTIDQVFAGGTVSVPSFDFKSGKKIFTREIETKKNDKFMFEGIQAVYPEVTALFRGHSFASVFISVFQGLEAMGNIYRPEEIRFLRRIVRDYNFRNASAEFTFNLWQNVRKNEQESILPNVDKCKIIIDSVMPYEICMLKPFLVPILKTLPSDSEYYEFAQSEIKKFSHIDVISKNYIPENSMYHEFLG